MDLEKKIRYTTIRAEHVNSKGRATKKENRIPAIIKTVLALSDGGWHTAKGVKEICLENCVSYDQISKDIKLAESDNGSWVAILHDDLTDPPTGRKAHRVSLYGFTENYSVDNKRCLSCGQQEILIGANFCPQCGVKFKWQNQKQ